MHVHALILHDYQFLAWGELVSEQYVNFSKGMFFHGIDFLH